MSKVQKRLKPPRRKSKYNSIFLLLANTIAHYSPMDGTQKIYISNHLGYLLTHPQPHVLLTRLDNPCLS